MTAGNPSICEIVGGHRPPLQWAKPMRRKRFLRKSLMKAVIAITLGLLILSTGLLAQNVSVSQVTGTVKDRTGAILPGVEVKITQTETGLTRTVLTNETGFYSIPNLPIGPDSLEGSSPGFKTATVTDIVLQVSSKPAINVELEVGSVAEQVDVIADAATVETQSTGVGNVIENQRILEMPLNGRQATELI